MAYQAKSKYNLKTTIWSITLVKVRTLPLFVPEMSTSFPSYVVQIICIYLIQILQSLQFGLLPTDESIETCKKIVTMLQRKKVSDHFMLQWQQGSKIPTSKI
jgi:hypothetical protein